MVEGQAVTKYHLAPLGVLFTALLITISEYKMLGQKRINKRWKSREDEVQKARCVSEPEVSSDMGPGGLISKIGKNK